MAIPKPVPLFPSYEELSDFNWGSYPDLKVHLDQLPDWCAVQWGWATDFLLYVGRNKSDHTFTRFRSEVEKFLLWVNLVTQKRVDTLRKSDVLDYAEFFFKPPQSWIGLVNVEKFKRVGGEYRENPEWRPFRYISDTTVPDKKQYRPSQQSMQAMFTAITAFYKFLMDEEVCLGNPAQIAKKDCKRLIKDTQIRKTKRLDKEQWAFLLEVATQMANEDPTFERNLFLIAAMKTMFLRISELSERDDWIPIMSHFWQDDDKNWWLNVYGKGRKLRDVSVPDGFILYLERYRISRGLPELPTSHERQPIIAKSRGTGGMTARQLSRLVDHVLSKAYLIKLNNEGSKAAQVFKDATSHWLRHTGASLEIDRGRALKDVSEDLGHSSMATTDSVYVQASAKNRAKSGKSREV
ncbi:tyrosine-type recombinase/integrase [Saccharospirillum sp.]|uniref:tyrosine-type recombinase/integrase n=1 Tax=Saccharospirillum sp. TaxID=2033801 RepID=UPI0034A023A1